MSRRAIRPSSPSMTAATAIAITAASNRPSEREAHAGEPGAEAEHGEKIGQNPVEGGTFEAGAMRRTLQPPAPAPDRPDAAVRHSGAALFAHGVPGSGITGWTRPRVLGDRLGRTAVASHDDRLQRRVRRRFGRRQRRDRSRPRSGEISAITRLAADHGLAFQHQGQHALRQIEIGAAAEADDAEAARPPGHESPSFTSQRMRRAMRPGDLHDRDLPPVGQADGERVALVLVRRLVEIGAEELAVAIGDAGHRAVRRHAVHMHVEHREENRDAPAGQGAEAEFRRRHGERDADDMAVGRRQQHVPGRGGGKRSGSRKK